VADILKFIESIAPPYMAESWDNVGLLCGRKEKPVTKILVALDPFASVIDQAIREGADLIVTHHPLIFRDKLMAVNEDTQTGENLLTLMEHGIAAINAHTNLDLAPGGVNDILAATLGLGDVQIIRPEGTDEQGRPYGLLRSGTVAPQALEAFLAHVKQALGCDGLRYVNSGKAVSKVAVGGGSCADGMQEALEAGCDTFVTADVSTTSSAPLMKSASTSSTRGISTLRTPPCPSLRQSSAGRSRRWRSNSAKITPIA